MENNVTYLEKRHPEKNQYRFYRVSVSPTLFGEYAVIREWGRIGRTGRMKEHWFVSIDEAYQARQHYANVKTKRGYRVIF